MNKLTLNEKKTSIADLWEICVEFMYDFGLIWGINKVLKKHRVKTILDCACGTGYPSIYLKKIGYDVTCSDKSKEMLDKFKENCKSEKVKIKNYRYDWQDLSKKIKKKFDCVLCRGNSLVYVISWNKPSIDVEKAEEAIKDSLKNMYNCLKKDGILYVDLLNDKENTGKTEFGTKIINGKPVSLLWEVYHDQKLKTRTWVTTLITEDTNKRFSYFSYLLTSRKLYQMLKEVGFSKVSRNTKVEGEQHYNVFIAKK